MVGFIHQSAVTSSMHLQSNYTPHLQYLQSEVTRLMGSFGTPGVTQENLRLLLVCRKFSHVFIVLHRVNSRLLVQFKAILA